ncbi:hypothetical protein [Brevibacillus laterosporus]|uniref:hypothetical protein n=1 Tax=Brevibacillus laterosporus TaxID=1465 RepID=UPI002656F3AF|nr:hypothetical protein [Brevibacillus laterosporus]MDN9010462.1 hypothetical protein [Brevibacillus laterosporus]MDO0941629.1 hypothetical protein [Brevibacillus laterosporus]
MQKEKWDEIPLIIPLKPIVSPSFIACSHSCEKGELSICTINLEKGKKKTIYPISHQITKISISPTGNVIYGAELGQKDNKNEIAFYRIKTNEKRTNKIAVTPADEYRNKWMETNSLNDVEAHLSEIYALDDQYAIFFISNSGVEYGKPYYSDVFLIDSIESSVYKITSDIGHNDSLLRLDSLQAFYADQHCYFYMKTGRIYAYEKQNMWRETKASNPYYDHLETIMIFNTKDFIEQVKGNQKILNGKLVEQVNYNQTLSEIDITAEGISYLLGDIPNDAQCLIKYKASSDEKDKIFNETSIQEYKNRDVHEDWLYEHISKLQNNMNDRYTLETRYNHYNVFLSEDFA